MPIWSLTKERLEKLLAQIRDMEVEIDALIKLTREELWSRDLDDFINEWRTQLDEEAKLRKQMASMGRRASSKLNIGGKVPKRQRKAQGEDPDDSDFEAKAVARKAAPVKRAQPKSTMLSDLAPSAKPVVKKKPTATSKAKTLGAMTTSSTSEDRMPLLQTDGAVSGLESVPVSDLALAPIFQKPKAAVTSKKIVPAPKATSKDVDDDEADEDIIRPVASRQPRQAAKKIPTYNLDDSDSDGDDMLLDVGKMVKGIGNTSSDQATTTRPLFSTSMSRPGSSAGLPKKSSSLSRQPMEIDGDDTDYSKLAPPPAAKRGISVTARRTAISDDDDDDDDDEILPVRRKSPPPKVSKMSKASKIVATKPAAKAKAKESTTASSKLSTRQPVSQPPKKTPLSPAAKAYAAKHAKNKALVLDDDSDDEIDEKDEEDEVDRVANAILDEGNEESEDEADDEPVVRRPARRAAAQAAAKVTEAWGDESEEDDDEDSETFNDDESE